jgi:hypothetical protein
LDENRRIAVRLLLPTVGDLEPSESLSIPGLRDRDVGVAGESGRAAARKDPPSPPEHASIRYDNKDDYGTGKSTSGSTWYIAIAINIRLYHI